MSDYVLPKLHGITVHVIECLWMIVCYVWYFSALLYCPSYLLWRVSHEGQGILTQWPLSDPMGIVDVHTELTYSEIYSSSTI